MEVTKVSSKKADFLIAQKIGEGVMKAEGN